MNNRLFLTFICGLAVCFACNTPAGVLRKTFLDENATQVLVAAHRAAHQIHPENSLPAIQHAIDLGVDIIELDVQVTKDGIPVLMHDRTIDRTTTGSGRVPEYTLQELRQLRLIHQGDTTDQLIPTFEEALRLSKKKVLIDVDLKTDQLAPILAVAKATGTERQLVFFDSDYEALHYIQAEDPGLLLMPRAYSYEMADSAITAFSPEIVHIDFSFYDRETVRLIRENRARIWINALGGIDRAIGTTGEQNALDSLLRFGANVVQTDNPRELIDLLRSRGLHP
ncbi:glycerophosphodiester phosphodiesterase family protein [Flavilitoribacter nigricans]|uniref:Glycerophosphodiester phosphodiesterase n=1 Tax=Flavilitoribacter nigricans (strain ATCC 23147 / DSM 23189 / NBRC 102662 / NCIMB 1420 / SS-2) TaxID=1122177 RepID=A0A2D0NAB8_FLAN2|nr:glycerophosphodiester phosphodiesterase family protein [Flavilitoribacter nigricans]PHN05454.1 glycerophosphodiester phosphodiesterase [Flavilitoribacter nigricans DSM 23189 = NBRC 102662]